MTPTPERALELADEYDRQADRHILIAADPFADAEWQQEQADECLEKATILRHYAEILPKWQAVLDAEPVGSVVKFLETRAFAEHDKFQQLPPGTQLIIKPAP